MDMLPNDSVIAFDASADSLAMADFPLHTRATAPFASKPIMEEANRTLGYVPNLVAQMAEAPALLEGYATLSAIFRKADFTPTERALILLAVSVEHDSHYCTPAHTVRARDRAGRGVHRRHPRPPSAGRCQAGSAAGLHRQNDPRARLRRRCGP
jgi:alkylhydroperoxidase/carboxymuconolactone decarboxylase family protein YurZ